MTVSISCGVGVAGLQQSGARRDLLRLEGIRTLFPTPSSYLHITCCPPQLFCVHFNSFGAESVEVCLVSLSGGEEVSGGYIHFFGI